MFRTEYTGNQFQSGVRQLIIDVPVKYKSQRSRSGQGENPSFSDARSKEAILTWSNNQSMARRMLAVDEHYPHWALKSWYIVVFSLVPAFRTVRRTLTHGRAEDSVSLDGKCRSLLLSPRSMALMTVGEVGMPLPSPSVQTSTSHWATYGIAYKP